MEFDKSFPIQSHPRIPDLVLNQYTGSHLAELQKKFNDLLGNQRLTSALKGNSQGGTGTAVHGSSDSTPTVVPRTVASPDWDGETPPSFDTVMTFETVPMETFDSSYALLSLF